MKWIETKDAMPPLNTLLLAKMSVNHTVPIADEYKDKECYKRRCAATYDFYRILYIESLEQTFYIPKLDKGNTFEFYAYCECERERRNVKRCYEVAKTKEEIFDDMIANYHVTYMNIYKWIPITHEKFSFEKDDPNNILYPIVKAIEGIRLYCD